MVLGGLAWLIRGVGVTLFITGVPLCILGVPFAICGVPRRLGGCWLRWWTIGIPFVGCACWRAEDGRAGLLAFP